MASGMAYTVTSARYFPHTIPAMEAREVSRSWSVFWRRSSTMLRMVSSGTTTRKMNVVL
jgi:hypothetical protein